MSAAVFSRRVLLKAGLVIGVVVLGGIRFGSEAHARVRKLVKSYMRDRLNAVYYTDATMPVRASQDNEQVQTVYRDFLGEPGGELAHKYLHMHFSDRSKAMNALKEEGKLANPGGERFKEASYPFEWTAQWFSRKK